MFAKKTAVLAGLAGLLATAATAQGLTGSTAAQVTIVQGPGPDYAIVSEAPASEPLTITGCTAQGDWCRVEANGAEGWVRADALNVVQDGQTYLLTQRPQTVKVKTVEVENEDHDKATGAGIVAGAAAGAMVAGPPGAVVGGIIGGATGAATTPPTKEVTTYTVENPVPSVAYSGDLKVGTVLPSDVMVTPVPESDYAYVYLDNTPVVVDQHHRIVTIVR